jgi:hypothetical protein
VPPDQRRHIRSIAVDGTSSTALLIDGETGQVLAEPKLYNEVQPDWAVEHARRIAPPDHTATAATSTLCKAIAWDGEQAWQQYEAQGMEPAIVHQADWIAGEHHSYSLRQ